MTLTESLCRLYLHCDQIGGRAVIVPMEDMRALIVEAARVEGDDRQLPWEPGRDYEERKSNGPEATE